MKPSCKIVKINVSFCVDEQKSSIIEINDAAAQILRKDWKGEMFPNNVDDMNILWKQWVHCVYVCPGDVRWAPVVVGDDHCSGGETWAHHQPCVSHLWTRTCDTLCMGEISHWDHPHHHTSIRRHSDHCQYLHLWRIICSNHTCTSSKTFNVCIFTICIINARIVASRSRFCSVIKEKIKF